MSDWVHTLPFGWLAALVFGLSYAGAGMIHALVARLAVGERGRAFKAVSPGMLPPLGIIFGLFVAFTAAQVWSDIDRANAAVSREASSLRAAVILSSTFPGEPEARLRGLIRQYVQEAVDQEWPMMASQAADLRRPRARSLRRCGSPLPWRRPTTVSRPHSENWSRPSKMLRTRVVSASWSVDPRSMPSNGCV